MDIRVAKEKKLLRMETVIRDTIKKENFMDKVNFVIFRCLSMG